MNDHPRVGVGVIIKKENKVLLGRRKSPHEAGTWSFPGGHLEHGEEIFTCAKREAFEETGLLINCLEAGPYTNDIFDSGKHYLTLFVIATVFEGTPKVREPKKSEAWDWFTWDDLPQPLFLPAINLIKKGFDPFS